MTNEKLSLRISELVAQYSYYWDGFEKEKWTNLFTDDGVWELYEFGKQTPAVTINGKDELYKWADDLMNKHKKELRQTHHHQNNLILNKIAKTSIQSQNMALVTHQVAGGDIKIAFSGIYYDHWVEVDKEWKIKKRIFKSTSKEIQL